MTVMEALRWANVKLKKAGVESPMLDAEILLAHTIGVKKSWLFSHFTEPLKTHQQESFHINIERRSEREPLAYILGRKEFYTREFAVNPFVLIPRPATETLVEKTLELTKHIDPNRTLLVDVGTGSGAIAVTLAAETGQPVMAIDMDQQSLLVAKQNAQTHEVSKLIEFQHGHLLEPIIRLFKTLRKTNEKNVSAIYPFETVIVCANLPYLAEHRVDMLQPEVIRYEPRSALFGGLDGLDAYWEMFKQLKTHRRILPRRIFVLIEIDPEQGESAIKLILHHFPTSKPQIFKDLLGLDRTILIQC